MDLKPPFALSDDHHFSLRYRVVDAENHSAQHSTINPLEALNHDPAKRTVIVLPGTRMNREVEIGLGENNKLMREMIEGMLAVTKRSLETFGTPPEQIPNIYCAIYTHNDEELVSHHWARRVSHAHPCESGAPTPAGTDVHEFTNRVLLPFAGLSGHARPPMQELCDRLSTLTLEAHSLGTAFAREIGACFYRALVARGYTPDQADFAVKQVQVLAYANTARVLDNNEPGFTIHTFTGRHDPVTWHTLGRVAEDHVRDGLIPADQQDAKQREYYAAAGCDPELIDHPLRGEPGMRYDELANGSLTTELLPAEIPIGRRVLTDDMLIDEAVKVNNALTDNSWQLIGLNSQPLISPITPQHDVRMLNIPGNVRGKSNDELTAAEKANHGIAMALNMRRHACVHRQPAVVPPELTVAQGRDLGMTV